MGGSPSDAQLDRAVIDDCLRKLNAIFSEYERIRNPTDVQALVTLRAIDDTKATKCGLQDQLKSDPGYRAFAVRIQPMLAPAEAAIKRCNAIDGRIAALKPEVASEYQQIHQAMLSSTCYQVCVGNGYNSGDCYSRCPSRSISPRVEAAITRIANDLRGLAGCGVCSPQEEYSCKNWVQIQASR